MNIIDKNMDFIHILKKRSEMDFSVNFQEYCELIIPVSFHWSMVGSILRILLHVRVLSTEFHSFKTI